MNSPQSGMANNLSPMSPYLNVSPRTNFPVSSVPPTIRELARYIQATLRAPGEMILTQSMAIASAAGQGLADVENLNGITPISLNFVTLGVSGERKTSTTTMIASPLTDYDKRLHEASKRRTNEYQVEISIWKIKHEALKKLLTRNVRAGKSSDDIEEQLRLHLCIEPIEPKPARIIYSDFTPESLKKSLSECHPIGIVLNDEAGDFFKGAMMREYKFFNKLFNGGDFSTDRITSGSLRVESPRVAQAIMMQPSVFKESFKGRGTELIGSGLSSRYLICYPDSTQGYRFNNMQTTDRSGIDKFHQRITEMLERTFLNEGESLAQREILTLSAEAKHYLNEMNNSIELNLRPGRIYYQMQEFASKMLEHTCRLAAVFHLIEGRCGNSIGLSDVQGAYNIISWYAVQYYELVVLNMAPTQKERDAEALYTWFLDKRFTMTMQPQTKAEIKKNCTAQLRDYDRLNPALDTLVAKNLIIMQVWPAKTPNGKVTTTYHLNLQMLPQQH